MARVIWTGALAFGLVNIPVGLYAATEDRTVHFNQFQNGTSDRIRYKRVNERTGEEVNYRDIVKGREVDDDTYVLLTDDELESVEPGRTRTIDITNFVDLAEVDPIYFQRTYYLSPRGDGAGRSYELLAQGDGRHQPGRYRDARHAQQGVPGRGPAAGGDPGPRDHVLRGRDPQPGRRDGLRAVRPPARPRELTIARQLIESMTTDWDPARYVDTYRERVEELIESKRTGETIETAAPAPQPSKVVDLTETLRRSVEEARGRTRESATRGSESGERRAGKRRPESGGRESGGRESGGRGGGRSAPRQTPGPRTRTCPR